MAGPVLIEIRDDVKSALKRAEKLVAKGNAVLLDLRGGTLQLDTMHGRMHVGLSHSHCALHLQPSAGHTSQSMHWEDRAYECISCR